MGVENHRQSSRRLSRWQEDLLVVLAFAGMVAAAIWSGLG